ncbi:21077_t:CDS:2 [Dentiscutata erythropus]|uniref:21077_t:CDS:1 n=1 Tax=Dentiscutata erythropus TaxID=1348616 RepID=A0A9N9EDN4_9GLOM|nr:21077_t:CDS:2 [Dentiscutata erythropus]
MPGPIRSSRSSIRSSSRFSSSLRSSFLRPFPRSPYEQNNEIFQEAYRQDTLILYQQIRVLEDHIQALT